MIVLDTECYYDYFLILMKEIETGKVYYFEIFPGNDNNDQNRANVAMTMKNHTTVSFNGPGYDLPLITAMTQGWDNGRLKSFSDSIIGSKLPIWTICKNNSIVIPRDWDHIDLMNVAPGIASLKVYGGRMGFSKMQDLPIEPGTVITPSMHKTLRKYCLNDVNTTEALYHKLKPQIDLRIAMTAQYGIDLRSKSDAQIAEAVIKSELQKITGKVYYKPKVRDGMTVRYQDPRIVSFKSPDLKEVFDLLINHEFELGSNGSILLSKEIKNLKITIGNAHYNLGIGGLHSQEKSQYVEASEDVLTDWDVASYYPSIILQQKLSPKIMGQAFLDLYQGLVTRRLEAKAAGDKVTADTLKICLNGSFGKLGSKFSPLYAPELLLQVTVTGQLCLLMLIERMTEAGVNIKSANTDGILCLCGKNRERDMERVAWDWMLDTSFMLERTDYRLVASRDVNNYVAVKTDGKVKRKGCFATGGLMKNPARAIVYTAIVDFLAKGTPLRETILDCKDINQFVTVRKVTGGAVWRGQSLGKACGSIHPPIRN